MLHNDTMYAVMQDRAARLQEEARIHRLSKPARRHTRRSHTTTRRT